MIYRARVVEVEAEPVLLAGESYYAVAVNGKGHLLHGPAFDVIFQSVAQDCGMSQAALADIAGQVEAEPDVPVKRAKPGRRKSVKRGRRIGDVTPTAPREFKSPHLEAALQALQHAPLTHAELAGYVYPDLASADARQKLHSIVSQLKERGLIEKREDPTAGGLMKWYAV